MSLNVKGDLTKTRRIKDWTISETGIHKVVISEMFRMLSWDHEPAWRNVPAPPVLIALIRIRVDFHEDGHGEITWHYEGSHPKGGSNQYGESRIIRALNGNTTREPIVSHPDIGKWLKDGFAKGFKDGEPDWVPKDPREKSKRGGFTRSGEYVSGINPLYGVTDYLAVGAEFTETESKRGKLPSDLFGQVGRVFETPPGLPQIYGRNWLMAGLSARQRGNAFTIRKHWLMSGIGGWLYQLYQPAALKK